MNSQEINLEVLDEVKPLNYEDQQEDIKKNSSSSQPRISFLSHLFFLWTLDTMKLSNKGQLKKDVIRKSTLFTSSSNKEELNSDFIFLKKLWQGNRSTPGYSKFSTAALIITITRFNFFKFLGITVLSFMVHGLKMGLVFYKRKIIKLFFNREQNKIVDYTPNKFRLILYKNISLFLIIEATRFILNHQLKFNQRKITRKTNSLLSLLIYDKFMIQKLLEPDMKEGDLINYFQTDVESLTTFFQQISKIIVFPFQFVTYFVVLYKIFNKALFVGIFMLNILIILSVFLQKRYVYNQFDYLKEKDKRINFTSQTIKNIKELKLLQWEDTFKDVINKKRKKEMIFMRKKLNYSLYIITLHWIMPFMLCFSTIGAYVLFNQKFLEIADLMTGLEIFDSIRGPLVNLPARIREIINAFVSMHRIEKFLKKKNSNNSDINNKLSDKYSIDIQEAKIGTNDNNVLMTVNKLRIKKGESCIIIGETGSGKSCLIKSLIDRLIILNKKEFNIDGKISYASQTPFIVNASVKDNILFYSECNEERYNQTIKFCELEKDIDTFPAGDQTEIGTNGANLSGGQKSRINLARCVYKEADIYLFDDPISSVDAIVFNKILNNLIKNFLKNKTVIFASNDIKYMNYFDKVIFVQKEKIKFFGTVDEIKTKDFFNEFKSNFSSINKNDENNIINKNEDESHEENMKEEKVKSKNSYNDKTKEEESNKLLVVNNDYFINKEKGKLMIDEEIKNGKINSIIYKTIIKSSGGYLYIVLVFIFAILWQFTLIYGNMYLTSWSDKNNKKNKTKEKGRLLEEAEISNNNANLKAYSIICGSCIICLFIKEFLISRMNYNISYNFHNRMIENIIDAPINLYHDITPFGQIMNKLTMDLDKCVEFFSFFSSTLNNFCILVGAIIVCIKSNIYILIIIPFIFYFGYRISIFYAPAGRDILRIESINRTPLISFYSESIQGIDTIKSLSYHNVHRIFFAEFSEKILQNLSVYLFKFGSRALFELSLDLLSVFFVFFIFIYCIFFHENFTAVIISLLLKYSMSLSDEIFSMLTHGTELENSFVKIERCEACFNLPKEDFTYFGKTTEKNINMDFIEEGRIEFDKIFIKYRPNLDCVLKNMTFAIKPKEKICIMGRTGSGKSTIILALFRIVESFQGKIYVSGKNIKKINLKNLRQCLGIVPQEPKIFSGTLKFNVDPMGNYTDIEINNALNEVGLFKLMEENGRDTSQKLEMKFDINGGNLSLGEKQLICLARIFLRKNKIVVMDEATSNIDNKTDILIQNAVDKIFKNSTLITIAHKIPDLNKYDKIMILDEGCLIEYDTPFNLLKKNNGIFRQLYNCNLNVNK